MKARLRALAARIDALSLRERLLVFAGLVAIVSYVLYFGWLNPLAAKQKTLQAKIGQARNNITGIEAEMGLRARQLAEDPDAANRARLQVVRAEANELGTNLRTMQKALVAPDKIVPLLEAILKRTGRLRLVSLKKLPVVGFNDPLPGTTRDSGPKRLDAPGNRGAAERVTTITPATVAAIRQPPAAAAAGASAGAAVDPKAGEAKPPKPPDLLFRHGVEMTLSGSYLDMIAYMEALEAMPTQLFWGKAEFEVDQFPNAHLTLTLYTVSMDQKWMKL